VTSQSTASAGDTDEPRDPHIQHALAEQKQRPSLLVIVRHGQSLRNTFDVHAGIEQMPKVLTEVPDHLIPLTPEGERESIATGEGLRAEFGNFDYVFHSPWLRTTQTAQLIAQSCPPGVQLRRNLYLIEQNFGQLDPALWPHELERYEEAYRRFEMQRAIVGKFYCRPPDGESWADVCMRTHQFLGTIFRPEFAGTRLLIITHGVTQQTFRYHLEHPTEEELVEEYQQTKNRNCGHGAYTWSPETGWHLLHWNKTHY
jgi:broad specificity phosphatase PhoE